MEGLTFDDAMRQRSIEPNGTDRLELEYRRLLNMKINKGQSLKRIG